MSSKHRTPKRISLFVLACLLPAVFLPTGSLAQQPAKIPRIGYLTGQVLPTNSYRTEALRQGLRELGYIEGKTIAIEWRGADGNRDRQRALAAELVRLKVDVIVNERVDINPFRQGGNFDDSDRHDSG